MSEEMIENSAWRMPSRTAAAWRWLRVAAHVLLRGLGNMLGPGVPHHMPSKALQEAPVIAEHRTPLWSDGRDDEFLLVAGKVQNLRVAQPAFDGIVVAAGAVVSFWRQLGRPSRWRGFVEGREVRAGCVVPTIAGGLCQLSNALATCAARCGMTLVEQHGHTARIEAGAGRPMFDSADATVFWNYVDLRFEATFDFRIEVELTSDELVVRVRAFEMRSNSSPRSIRPISIAPQRSSLLVARGCLTCDEVSCFRHRVRAPTTAGITATLVNARTPEFARHLEERASPCDWFTPWVRPARRLAAGWAPPSSSRHGVALIASLRRTLLLRQQVGEGAHRQAAVLQGDRWLADWYARHLEARHTHLVIDQSLLAVLAQKGILGGRTFEVLVHALPAGALQQRLDAAAQRWPDAASLRDFRVSDAYCKAEANAMRAAQRLITPHAEVARHLRATFSDTPVEMIDWLLPSRLEQHAQVPHATPVVAFPASALARKGALEMAQAMRHLGWRLMVLGTPSSDPRLWAGVDVTHFPYRDFRWLSCVDVVALPAYIEHSPRGLLAAAAHGLPIVASPECGLPLSFGAIEVQAGDVLGLIAALHRALEPARHRVETRAPCGTPC